jgi:hypothetical protein
MIYCRGKVRAKNGSKSFFLASDQAAFVPPQILERHDLTTGLSGVNFFDLFGDMLLYCIFDGYVLTIRGSEVA